MTWQNANDWAASLTVGGYTDWRLPTADPACGFNINCSGSEMGHLFYDELGGIAGPSILSSGDPDLGLFSNIQDYGYWSATEVAPNPSHAWVFFFSNGIQSATIKDGGFHAWALRSGDVAAAPAPVPEPGTIVLLGSLSFKFEVRQNASFCKALEVF